MLIDNGFSKRIGHVQTRGVSPPRDSEFLLDNKLSTFVLQPNLELFCPSKLLRTFELQQKSTTLVVQPSTIGAFADLPAQYDILPN